ncbi:MULTISPECIES: DUF3870 domain-containing protein [Sporomusa]|jgi:hypothetical protein|uniref:DUF3870 domain-containing protein n=1 Tax=Sporomusa sphaeroides DSM 2875 TaxID=1337886 RepID=A0ABM9VZR0_9FIRM|nr:MULTISPECIES: DUF3870 domain-containing protein [Sporomusa]MCM0759918.1 DUF3870 domain-containing protein [Sporomusa sphaeroides DSM 2875]OLS56297.1 hypothetical protein SPSPH_26900 [Sporomusa sphaeroides DSM 2875]CVK18393.1 hypothetical protein SSPH_01031 [Sporomusa sphaeroides DSM 2875]HML33890.1 DUF3870 domain-containing protein [Sporomusa sphaeroides]
MDYAPNTIFITGQAKPSKEDAISTVYNVFFLSFIVDTETDLIVDVTCNTVRTMTQDFIRSLLIGQNLATGIDGMVRDIQQRFFGLVQKTLIVALKDAHNRYMMVKKNIL